MIEVGSLFAGVGGFDLAAERANMEVIWQSENDKFACQTLEDRFPLIPNLGDIHDISIPDTAPAPDLLVGGFPCQSYSVAGSRGGLADDRGALWWEFRRLIAEGRPRWVVGENVPGLLSSRGGRDFAIIIDSLVELGYRVAWRVLDAQYFGVAQRRRRVFIVANLGTGSPFEVLALSEGMQGHPRPSREEGPEAAEGPEGGSRGVLADTGVVRALTQRYGQAGTDLTDAEAGHVVVAPLMAGKNGPRYDLDGGAYIPFVQNSRDEVRVFDETNGAQISGSISARPGIKQQTFLAYNIVPESGQGADLRASEIDTATAITATYAKGHDRGVRIVQPNAVRRLTPLECERLQGFPDNWTEGRSDTQRYRQMGNAVAVPVAEWIMKRIAAQERA